MSFIFKGTFFALFMRLLVTAKKVPFFALLIGTFLTAEKVPFSRFGRDRFKLKERYLIRALKFCLVK